MPLRRSDSTRQDAADIVSIVAVNEPSERVRGFADQAAVDAAEMGVDGQRVTHLDKAILGGPPQKTGRFEYRYDNDTWTWSDTVARMHGYEPEEVTPTTDLVLSHKHPRRPSPGARTARPVLGTV